MSMTKTKNEKPTAIESPDRETVKVFVPATVTNVGCGFDVLGFALREPGEIVELRLTEKKGIHIEINGPDADLIPLEANQNTAGVPVKKMMGDFGINKGITITITKSYGIGSGLGSSAASAVGAVVGMNRLFQLQLSNHQILDYALLGEQLASGGDVHIDNLAAALYGGFIFIHKTSSEILSLPLLEDLQVIILHPRLNLKTSVMRSILKREIPLSQAVTQWSNLGAFLIAWYNQDKALMKKSMKDVIVEPVRGRVIPEFSKIQQAALEEGAIGCSISGSGPSIFSFVVGAEKTFKIKEKWESIMDNLGLPYDIFITQMSPDGARIIE